MNSLELKEQKSRAYIENGRFYPLFLEVQQGVAQLSVNPSLEKVSLLLANLDQLLNHVSFANIFLVMVSLRDSYVDIMMQGLENEMDDEKVQKIRAFNKFADTVSTVFEEIWASLDALECDTEERIEIFTRVTELQDQFHKMKYPSHLLNL